VSDLDPEEFRRLGHAVVDWVAAYRAGLPDRPVRPDVAPGEVRRGLGELLPDRPQPLDALWTALQELAGLPPAPPEELDLLRERAASSVATR